MGLRVLAGGFACVVVVATALLLSSRDETSERPQRVGPDLGGQLATAVDDSSSPNTHAAETISRTPDERAAARQVTGLNDNVSRALEAGVAPLQGDVRAGINSSQGVTALTDVCESMSDDARKETVQYIETTSGFGDVKWTCEKAVALLIRRAKVSSGPGRLRIGKVVAVNVEGDHATATIDYGRDRPLGSVPVVKEDGDWKIGSPPPPPPPGGSER